MPRWFCLQTLYPARILSLSVENKFHGSLMGYILVSDIDHPQATAERISELFSYMFPMWVVFIIIEFCKEKEKKLLYSAFTHSVILLLLLLLLFQRYGHDYLNDHNVKCKLKIMFVGDAK